MYRISGAFKMQEVEHDLQASGLIDDMLSDEFTTVSPCKHRLLIFEKNGVKCYDLFPSTQWLYIVFSILRIRVCHFVFKGFKRKFFKSRKTIKFQNFSTKHEISFIKTKVFKCLHYGIKQMSLRVTVYHPSGLGVRNLMTLNPRMS